MRSLLLWVAAMTLGASFVLAQTVSGVISGTVKDPTGAVVVNAKVTLTDESTGVQRFSAETNELGLYTFNSVQPRSYVLEVTQNGFKTFRRTNIVLTANERLPIDVMLELGNTTESVTVEAQGASVDTVSAERSGVVTASQLASLQMKGRDIMSTFGLLPGVYDSVSRTRDAPGYNTQTGIYVMGQDRALNVTFDGVTSQDLGAALGNFFAPSADAIAEVKVLISNYQAEYGRNSGGTVNLIVKSGTNQFHGSAYEYKRNEALNANDFFNNMNSTRRPRYRYDIFGFTVGGPATIPRVLDKTKEKLFFFFSMEGSPQKSVQHDIFGVSSVTVPTQLERSGDFSQTFQSAGVLRIVKDPSTGQPFSNNVVPPARLNHNGQALLNIFPLPNTSAGGLQYNYYIQSYVEHARNVETLRVDYVITPKTTVFWRGIRSAEEFRGNTGFTGPAANWPQALIKYALPSLASVLNVTTVVSPRAVNEFTWGINRSVQQRDLLNDQTRAQNLRSTFGLGTLGQFYPNSNPKGWLPDASFGGVPNAASLALETKFPFIATTNIWAYTDNFSYVKGAHLLKAGIYFEPGVNNAGQGTSYRGSFNFGSSSANPLDSNWAYANAVLGNFQSYQEANGRVVCNTRQTNLEWYLQDTWKVSRRLTLDLGLRMAWVQPSYAARDNVAAFNPGLYSAAKAPTLYQPAIVGGKRVGVNPLTGVAVPAVLIGAFVPGSGDIFNGMQVLANDKSLPRGMTADRGVQYGPRFGFAYDVFGTGKTAIRGGAGIFYNRITTIISSLTTNPPLLVSPIVYYNNLDTYLGAQQSLFPTNVSGVSPSGEVMSAMNWSFGIQQNVHFNTVLDVAYVGSVARHTPMTENINQIPYGTNFLAANQDPTTPGKPLPTNFLRPYPGYGNITYNDFSGSSNYHSMQVQANRRFARSVQYGLAWTWSKAMNYGSSFPMYAGRRFWGYGRNTLDHTHDVAISYTWDLPNVPWNNVFARQAFDHWQLSGITSFISGAALGISLATTDSADIAGGGDGVRPLLLQNPILPKSERTFYRFFNTAAFGRPPQGSLGTAARDNIRGPGINNWDISISKKWPILSEKRLLQFRLEMYNAWNHTQFSSLDTAATFAPNGSQTNTRFGQMTAAYPARQMQMALRFTF